MGRQLWAIKEISQRWPMDLHDGKRLLVLWAHWAV
jgi:hypothetical protein